VTHNTLLLWETNRLEHKHNRYWEAVEQSSIISERQIETISCNIIQQSEGRFKFKHPTTMDSKQLGSFRLTTERIHQALNSSRNDIQTSSSVQQHHEGTQTRSQASNKFPRGKDIYFYHIIHSSVNHFPLQDFGLHLVEVPSLLTASLHTSSWLRSDLLFEDKNQHHKCRFKSQPASNHPLHKIMITLWLVAWRCNNI